MMAFIYGGVGMGSAAVGNFLPSIIKSFGYSASMTVLTQIYVLC